VSNEMSRRKFVKLGVLATAGLGILGCNFLIEFEEDDDEIEPQLNNEIEKEEEQDDYLIPRRKLGRTEMMVSIFGLGGAFTVSREHKQEEAVNIVNRALDMGVNYIDTAPTYGSSERNIGEAIKNRREETYLATKTLDYSYDGTMRRFEESLQNLQTSYIDLYQLHGIDSRQALEESLGKGGAIEALEELKKAGDIKFVGITGHKNYGVFLDALEEYDFDCALIPVNAGDVHDDSYIENVLPVLRDKNMGVIAMKVAAYGRIFRQNGINSMKQALEYTLTHPVDTAVIGISTLDELEENVRIAREFTPLTAENMTDLEELTRPYKREANFFKYDW